MRAGAVAATVCCAALASAQPARAETRPVVVLVVDGPERVRAPFVESLTELLGRLQVGLVEAKESDAAGLGGLALVRLGAADGRVSLRLDDRGGELALTRELGPGSEAVLLETAAHITLAAVEALIAPKRVKPPPLTPPPVLSAEAQAPAPPVAPARGFFLELGGAFGTRLFGGATPVAFRGEAQTFLGYAWGRRRLGALLTGAYHPPVEHSTELVTLRLQAVAVRGLVAYSLVAAPRLRLDVGLGAGADLLLSATSSAELPAGRLAGPRADASFVLTGLLAARWGLVNSADVFLALSADVDVSPPRYVTQLGPARSVLFAPWAVRPGLVLGFSFGAVGPQPYGGEP